MILEIENEKQKPQSLLDAIFVDFFHEITHCSKKEEEENTFDSVWLLIFLLPLETIVLKQNRISYEKKILFNLFLNELKEKWKEIKIKLVNILK